eukprot:9481774-Pyramimonas_sp.AAC.1
MNSYNGLEMVIRVVRDIRTIRLQRLYRFFWAPRGALLVRLGTLMGPLMTLMGRVWALCCRLRDLFRSQWNVFGLFPETRWRSH